MFPKFTPVLFVLASTIAAVTAFTGDLTYYLTSDGVGSCGKLVHDTEFIAAMAKDTYDTFPGATVNPNDNPICGRRIKITYNGKSIVVKVADRCPGCPTPTSIDLTPTAFKALDELDVGVLRNADWEWTNLPIGPVTTAKRAILNTRMIRSRRSAGYETESAAVEARETLSDVMKEIKEKACRGMEASKPTRMRSGKRGLGSGVGPRRFMRDCNIDDTNPVKPRTEDDHPQDKRDIEAGLENRIRRTWDGLVSRGPLAMERRWKDEEY